MTRLGLESHMMPLTACENILKRYRQEASALEKMGLSLVRYFVSFCMSKAFLSSLEALGAQSSSTYLLGRLITPRKGHAVTGSLSEEGDSETLANDLGTSKYGAYRVYRHVTYRQVDGHSVELSVLSPAHVKRRRDAPLIVRFHGGYLVMGSRLYPDWFQQWIIDYGAARDAVIISADYRLLPEASGADMVDDLKALWSWVNTELNPFLSTREDIQVDIRNTLVIGDSAGSHLAALSALQFCKFKDVHIRVMISAFGMLDLSHEHFSKKKDAPMPGSDPIPVHVVAEHLAKQKRQKQEKGVWPVVTQSQAKGRLRLAHAMLQHGLYATFLGKNSGCYTRDILASLPDDAPLPAFWIYHGVDDQVVPCSVSEGFVTALNGVLVTRQGNALDSVRFTKLPGGHGLDKAEKFCEPGWLRDGLCFVDKHWGGEFGRLAEQ